MNKLNHFQDFQDVLSHYHMSTHAREVLDSVNLVLLIGPSSAGRNTIIRELMKSGDYKNVVSDTTRNKRTNNGVLEQNGVEYWFRSEEEILDDLKNGEFLEAAIIHNQQVSGMSIRELESIQNEQKIAINEVQIDGAKNVHDAKPNTRIFFVIPPSFDIWIERTHGRGELPRDEIRRRLESARKEYAHALEHDFYTFIINDDLMTAVRDIDHIVKTGEIDSAKQESGRNATRKLLEATEAYLNS
jgi:guanylate kinase